MKLISILAVTLPLLAVANPLPEPEPEPADLVKRDNVVCTIKPGTFPCRTGPGVIFPVVTTFTGPQPRNFTCRTPFVHLMPILENTTDHM
jgi:hypothetical protein